MYFTAVHSVTQSIRTELYAVCNKAIQALEK